VIPVAAGFAFGERPATIQWAGMGLGLAAIAAISWEQAPQHAPRRRTVLPLMMAAAAGSGFAIYYILFSRRISAVSGLAPVLTARIASTIVVIGWIALNANGRGHLSVRRPVLLSFAITAGILASAGNLLFVLAVRQGQLAMVAVLASLYPAVTAALAIAFLKERPQARQLAGIGAAVAAVGMIAYG
jgi:drug/metabolite transporter (DMT)-like permease